jgi:hypothetical protein
MKFADTLGSKRKNRWKNISAVEEEDQLKVNLKILVCGVLIFYGLIFDPKRHLSCGLKS